MTILLPQDDSAMWPGLPLKGHICCMRFGDEKYFWTVEHLILLSSELAHKFVKVETVLKTIRSGKWFQQGQAPTIGDVLDHIERAMNAEAKYPIILSAEGRVMDGAHRIVAASIRGEIEIAAVQFTVNPKPQYVEKENTA